MRSQIAKQISTRQPASLGRVVGSKLALAGTFGSAGRAVATAREVRGKLGLCNFRCRGKLQSSRFGFAQIFGLAHTIEHRHTILRQHITHRRDGFHTQRRTWRR